MPRSRSFVSLARPVELAIACVASFAVHAQDLPTDAQVQAAFGTAYNQLGLVEYCQSKGFASAADVSNARKMVGTVTQGITVGAAAWGQEATGRSGTIVGRQVVGLMDASNPARPEVVPDGKTMSFKDNARAQKLSERTLCGQMARQFAPLP